MNVLIPVRTKNVGQVLAVVGEAVDRPEFDEGQRLRDIVDILPAGLPPATLPHRKGFVNIRRVQFEAIGGREIHDSIGLG
jgi:hypothetical protein